MHPRRVAIVHYWLVGMRGGEKVLEELVRLFPNAEIYTHVADREKLSPLLSSRPIHETFVSQLPFARKHYRKYLGMMPRALEEIDLRGFDLIISSESGPAKGVIAPPDVPHICYVHTPMRYIWDQYVAYREGLNGLERAYFSRLAHRLRVWDVTSAQRVDRFVANSTFVASRVEKYYRRSADVVHPPADTERFRMAGVPQSRGQYLFVSELVGYKKADIVVEAFRGLDFRLVVVGDGPERSRIARDLPPNVQLLGRVSDEKLAKLYSSARALIFPAEEDFGIVPVEAMACGTPVLAYGRGGVLDSVVPGTTGLFFSEQSAAGIRDCVQKFERIRDAFDHGEISRHAALFSGAEFRRKFLAIVSDEMEKIGRGSVL